LSPVLIYLSQPDVEKTILRIAEQRVSPEGDRWIDRVIQYSETSPFSKRNHIKGLDGALAGFAIRKQLEMRIISQLTIPYAVVENEDDDWDAVWAQIERFLQARD